MKRARCVATYPHLYPLVSRALSGNACTGRLRMTRLWAAPSLHPLQTCLATPTTSLQRYVKGAPPTREQQPCQPQDGGILLQPSK